MHRLVPAASIWFEIWEEVVDPGQQNFNFSRQISEKFRFFQTISRKISIFSGKFLKNFNFSGKIVKNFDSFPAKFQKILISSGNFKKFPFSRQKLLIYSYF